MPHASARLLQDAADSLALAEATPPAADSAAADSTAPDAEAVAEALLDSLREARADTSGILDVLGIKEKSAPVEVVGGLFDGLVEGLHDATGLSRLVALDLFLTAVVVVLLWGLRLLVLALVNRRTRDVRVRYQWRKTTSYAAVVVGALLLLRIWLGALGSLATFFGLLSAGVAIALKDPLSNLAGWLFIVWRRPFAPGDRITVRTHTGDVIDQRVFSFTLLEVGTETGAGQSTGRLVHVPNGWVFTDSLVNATRGFPYVWNELAVVVPFEADWRKAKRVLLALADEHAGTLSEDAERKLRRAAQEYMIFYSKLTPTVYTSVVDFGVQLTVRYLVEPRRRRGSEQQLWEAILDAFAAEPDLDLAYPTSRVFRASEEGKAGLRPQGERPADDGEIPTPRPGGPHSPGG